MSVLDTHVQTMGISDTGQKTKDRGSNKSVVRELTVSSVLYAKAM